jgi:hypothetical protein
MPAHTRTVVLKTKNPWKPQNNETLEAYVDVFTMTRFHAYHILNIYLLLAVEGQPVPPALVGGAGPPPLGEPLINQKTVGHALGLARGCNGSGASSYMLYAAQMYSAQPGVAG